MISFSLQQLFASIIRFIPRLILAAAIFVIFIILIRLISKIIKRFAATRHLPPDISLLLVQITQVSLYTFGGLSALATLGIDVWAIIAGLGLVGFAVGFALKDLLSNFLSGLFILIYSPFERGDKITVSTNSGEVIEINMRYTVLQAENAKILVPNSVLFSTPVSVEKNASASEPAGQQR